MFSSLLLDSNDSVVADRLSRLQDSLRALTLSTREEYQAAVYSMVNRVINLGDSMQPLIQVRSRPAIVGDLTGNLELLNQDATDIATELARIENNTADLYNLAAASQNAMRQLIRKSIYASNQKLFTLPFIEDAGLQSGYSASLDFNAGLAALPLGVETILSPSFAVGLSSEGSALSPLANLSSAVIGTSFEWKGAVLELLMSFDAPTVVNRLAIALDSYEGLEITSLVSSPDGSVFDDVLKDIGKAVLVLDATSGKCSGDVIIDFPPRIVTKMSVRFECRAGQQDFALRTVNAYRRAYQSSGVLSSLPVYLSGSSAVFSTDEVTTVPFTSISHQISTDGVSYVPVTPGIVAIAQPFWYRAVLTRSDSAFNQQSSPLLPLGSAGNSPYTIMNQTTTPLVNGMVEQIIVLSNITGPVVFETAPLAAGFRVQAGSVFLQRGTDYSLTGSTLTFAVPQSQVTLTYQASALGAAALASLKNYYSPLLYQARFQSI